MKQCITKCRELRYFFYICIHETHLSGNRYFAGRTRHRLPLQGIWAAPRALECVRKDFDYAFAQDKYRGVPEIELHEIDTARPFRVGDVEIVSVSGHHSERFEVTGFRIGTLAYLTDFKTIEDAEAEKLRGTEVLAVNALRFAPHPSHFNLAEALALIRRVGPREAYITHMSHEIGLHAETEATLPPGVHLAYDGLEVEI